MAKRKQNYWYIFLLAVFVLAAGLWIHYTTTTPLAQVAAGTPYRAIQELQRVVDITTTVLINRNDDIVVVLDDETVRGEDVEVVIEEEQANVNRAGDTEVVLGNDKTETPSQRPRQPAAGDIKALNAQRKAQFKQLKMGVAPAENELPPITMQVQAKHSRVDRFAVAGTRADYVKDSPEFSEALADKGSAWHIVQQDVYAFTKANGVDIPLRYIVELEPGKDMKGRIVERYGRLAVVEATFREFGSTDDEPYTFAALDSKIEMQINAVDAHIGSALARPQYNVSGARGICLIDTGIDHSLPQFSANYVGGIDYVNNDTDPLDDNGHGTSMADAIKTIAPGAQLYVTKVLDHSGQGYSIDAIKAIDWCMQQDVTIISISFGTGSYESWCDANLLAQKANEAASRGFLVVAAAGNVDEGFMMSPACGSLVTSVSASDNDDSIWQYSGFSNVTDLFAPGVGVQLTSLDASYVQSGTSISAAVSAGAAAIVEEQTGLVGQALQDRLRSTGALIGPATQYPRLDVVAAIINDNNGLSLDQQGFQDLAGEGNITIQVGICGDGGYCAQNGRYCGYECYDAYNTCYGECMANNCEAAIADTCTGNYYCAGLDRFRDVCQASGYGGVCGQYVESCTDTCNSWGSCQQGAGECSTSGTRYRDCWAAACSAGGCTSGSYYQDSEGCTYNPAGQDCGAGYSCPTWGSCEPGAGECPTSGTQYRTCTDYYCTAGGSCTSSSDPQSQSCTYNPAGEDCGAGYSCDTGTCEQTGGTCSTTGTRTDTCYDYYCTAGGSCTYSLSYPSYGCTYNSNGEACSDCWMSACTYDTECINSDTAYEYCYTSCSSGSCSGGYTSTPDYSYCDRNTNGWSCDSGAGTCSGGNCIPNEVCGNGIVEGGEWCDGSACCAANCYGYLSSATVCRAAGANPTCDPAEYCTGSSSTCPGNSYAASGTSCGSGNYCSGQSVYYDQCNGAGTCVSNLQTTCAGNCDSYCSGAACQNSAQGADPYGICSGGYTCSGQSIIDGSVCGAGAACGNTVTTCAGNCDSLCVTGSGTCYDTAANTDPYGICSGGVACSGQNVVDSNVCGTSTSCGYTTQTCSGTENSYCASGACQNYCATGGDQDGDGLSDVCDTDCPAGTSARGANCNCDWQCSTSSTGDACKTDVYQGGAESARCAPSNYCVTDASSPYYFASGSTVGDSVCYAGTGTVWLASTGRFVVKNTGGTVLGVIDKYGSFGIRGTEAYSQGAFDNGWQVKNSAGTVRASISTGGNFKAAGTLSERTTPSCTGFQVKNTGGTVVACITSTGAVQLVGDTASSLTTLS